MREKLVELGNQNRYTFQGKFQFYDYQGTGVFNHYYEEFQYLNFMIADLKVFQNGTFELIADHLWMTLTKQFLTYGWLEKGDILQFDGRITNYRSQQEKINEIGHPTKVSIVRNGIELMPDFFLLKKTYVDLVKEIKERNKEYYAARDFIDATYLTIPHYETTIQHWPKLQTMIVIDGKQYTQEEFKQRYFDREALIELHNSDKVLKRIFYNGEVKSENIISESDINAYVEKQDFENSFH